ncbi:hypothetical protein GETHLI_07040 [Geothrix limicola]|uniref:Tetratricopeptide repeat protein n=1 Tax=Geothrix limicola TaxID=2927978 RepID=A0ABQ5QBL1_9BACT|nr:tetratricopeptide repeat protein [Geothrix limicola]GLH72202.1 hypothetical protein GETHLI_07040 [Geothrix limicola]
MPLRLVKSHPMKPGLTAKEALRHPKSRLHQPSLAVLPFRNLPQKEDEGHVGEGIAEEVLLALNRVEGLRVISRTTSFLYGGSGLSPVEVGRRLGVHFVLSGELLESGGSRTLSTELVEVPSELVLWSRTCTFQPKDLFETVGDVTKGIAEALHLTLTPRSKQALDPQAYDYYLRGRQYYFRFNRQGMGFAAQMFRRALDVSPEYASAWAGLANCAAYSYIYIERAEPQRQLAESCSLKALELDPDLAEAHASRGLALSAAGLPEEAEEAFETALRLDPNLYEAAYFYARHCFAAGKAERAIEYFEWAAALRPEDFQAILLVAQVYHSLGVEDEAERARKAGLALVEARLQHAPDDVRARYLGANALVALGERDKGLAWARMAREMDPEDPMLLYNLGCIHALAGDPDEALDCLEKAAAGGLSQKDWFQHDGDLDALRALPRFQSLIEALTK